MFLLTIISIILFVMCLWYFVTPFNPGFESVSDALFNRDPFESSSNITNKIINGNGNEVFNSDVKYEVGDFWVYLSRFMMCVMIAAIILLIITRVLGHKGKVRDYKIDIPVYVLVILSFAVYYLTPILFAEYKVEMNRIHLRYFITTGYSLFMIVVCALHHRKKVTYEKKFLSDEEAFTKGRISGEKERLFFFVTAVVFAALLLINGKFFLIAHDYSCNYREYKKADHARRTDLEEEYLGNFQNEAVMTEEGLYFEGVYPMKVGEDHTINRLDNNGEITTVYSGEKSFGAIGYADGNLYGADKDGIYAINPDSGECKLVIEASDKKEIKDFCLIDNTIYYLEGISLEEKVYRTKSDDEKYETIQSVIWAADVSGDSVSEPYMYASDINTRNFYYYNGFLITRFIMNEQYRPYYGMNPQYTGDKVWLLTGDGYNYSNEDSNCAQCFFTSGGFPEEMYDIGCINIQDGAVYYVQLKEDGFDICKCNPDGSDIEVIDTYTDGLDYTVYSHKAIRMCLSDNKIVVLFNESHSPYGAKDALTYVVDR